MITFKSSKAKRSKSLNKPKQKNKTLSMQPYTRELACSVIDPFSCSACVPDGRTNTGCFSLKTTGTLGTGAGGSCCGLAVQGAPNAPYYVDTLSVNSTATVTGNWAQLAIATIAAQYQSYRVVSYGLRLNYVGNTQTDQGIIVCGQMPATMALSAINGLNAGQIANLSSDFRQYSLRNGCQVTWRPEEMTAISSFKQFGNSTLAVSSNQTISPPNTIFAWVFGCNAATASLVQYELIVNFEGQFNQQNYIPGGLQSKTSAAPRSEVGWYETAKKVIDTVDAIVPLVGSVLTAFGVGGPATKLGGMGNGVMYPARLSRSSLR